MDKYYTLQDIADFMGYKSTSTLRKLANDKAIPAQRIGKRMWIVYAADIPELRRLLDEREKTGMGFKRGKERKTDS